MLLRFAACGSVVLIFAAAQGTPALQHDWAAGFGATGGYAVALSVAVDGNGEVYTVGRFIGTVDFDPGASSGALTSGGSASAFVSKLHGAAGGGFGWARQLEATGAGQCDADGVAMGTGGSVYIVGSLNGTADFDPTPAGLDLRTSVGSFDAYVWKLDSASGSLIWGRQFGRAGGVAFAHGVAVAGDGSVYTVGHFIGTVDFDPDPVNTQLLTSAGLWDAFVSKLDANGNVVWAKRVGGSDFDWAEEVFVDGSGDIVVVGYFRGVSDFDPGVGVQNRTSAGLEDAFFLKLDSGGGFRWAQRLGAVLSDTARGVAVDGSDRVYAVGSFSGSPSFSPGPGTFTLTSLGSADVFVVALDGLDGSLDWARQLGGAGAATEPGTGVALDACGNIFTIGHFTSTADFDPGPATFAFTSVADRDVFVSKLDRNGNFVSAAQLGGSDSQYAEDVALGGSRVYPIGYFLGTADFDPGSGSSNLAAAGSVDAFACSLTDDPNDLDEDGVPVVLDNCPCLSNPDQSDIDLEGIGDVCDCSSANSFLWSVPGEVLNLIVTGYNSSTLTATFSWSPPAPADQGGVGSLLLYDLVRSTSPTAFNHPSLATCVLPSNLSATTASDVGSPPPNTTVFYLVRAQNTCGEGPLGVDLNNKPHTAIACP